jgi:hypothetical protein
MVSSLMLGGMFGGCYRFPISTSSPGQSGEDEKLYAHRTIREDWMPKVKQRAQRKARANASRAHAPNRRVRTSAEELEAPPKRSAPSQAMRLVAEVERLECELAAMRAQVAALEACAEIDPLTNLANRRGFERELKRACAYVKRYGTSAALIYVDLDDFKRVNDRHGHVAGDAMLRGVARCSPATSALPIWRRGSRGRIRPPIVALQQNRRARQGARFGNSDRANHSQSWGSHSIRWRFRGRRDPATRR